MSDIVSPSSIAELLTKVVREWINPNAFDGFAVQMKRIEFPSPLCIAQIEPVGSFVARSSKARFLNKGFHEDRTIRIARMPVVSQPLKRQRQSARSEVFAADPGQDQEARVIDDQMQ